MNKQPNKKTVVIGYLGTQLDNGFSPARWQKWRPTLSLVQQPDTRIDRLELFYGPAFQRLADRVVKDIATVAPHTQVNLIPVELKDPWDFGEVYASLYDWAHRYPFDPERERYWTHITTGTHVAQICLFLMVEARFIPGVLLQTGPPRKAARFDLPPPTDHQTASSSSPSPGLETAASYDEAGKLASSAERRMADAISGSGSGIAASADTRRAESSSVHYDAAVGSYTLIDLDLSRYDVLAQRFEHAQLEARAYLKNGIATRNPQFNALIDEIEQVAVRSGAPILLTGPTGAGKSHLARRMFELKKARHQVSGAFVEVNCATLRGDHAGATLFGHRRGAFTGAVAERAGLLRTAHQGVLFLDEIGELGLDEQAMLLKAVEEKRFLPLGSDQEVHSDFQLIAGTNRDLRHDVQAGRFREDLFARINLWTYSLPGLAQRPEDIEPNIEHLLLQAATAGGKAVHFSREAKARYLSFAQSAEAPWRGNFRDLSASITRLATLAEGGRITTDLVEAEIGRLRWLWQSPSPRPASTADQRACSGMDGSALPPTEAHGDAYGPHAATHTSATADTIATQPASAAGCASVDESPSPLTGLLSPEKLERLDLFDRLQLQTVIEVCRSSSSLAEAGRRLYDRSRTQRSAPNDSDRLRKYLLKFGLRWQDLA